MIQQQFNVNGEDSRMEFKTDHQLMRKVRYQTERNSANKYVTFCIDIALAYCQSVKAKTIPYSDISTRMSPIITQPRLTQHGLSPLRGERPNVYQLCSRGIIQIMNQINDRSWCTLKSILTQIISKHYNSV